MGTGAIIINNNELKGLNVAATMWCITAIGMLTGFGCVFESMIGTLVVIFINRFVNGSKKINMNERNINNDYYVKIFYDNGVNIDDKLSLIRKNIKSKKIKSSVINRCNICILNVRDIDYFKMKMFFDRMNCDKEIKSISFDKWE